MKKVKTKHHEGYKGAELFKTLTLWVDVHVWILGQPVSGHGGVIDGAMLRPRRPGHQTRCREDRRQVVCVKCALVPQRCGVGPWVPA